MVACVIFEEGLSGSFLVFILEALTLALQRLFLLRLSVSKYTCGSVHHGPKSRMYKCFM